MCRKKARWSDIVQGAVIYMKRAGVKTNYWPHVISSDAVQETESDTADIKEHKLRDR